MSFRGIDVNEIYTIVRKTEKEDLDFYNPDREGDGFVAVCSGKGYFKDDKNNVCPIKEGDIVVLRKNQRYYIFLEKGSSYVTSLYQLSLDFDANFPAELPKIIVGTKKQIDTLSSLVDIWQSKTWDSYTKSRIILLDFYLEIMNTQVSFSKTDKDINKAIKYIHENFKKNFSGEEIAEYCSVSLSHLRSKFLKQTGMTLTGYRDNLRMENAEEMLKSKNFTITEIALELGYCDVYHFSKAYKKIKGIPPSMVSGGEIRKI